MKNMDILINSDTMGIVGTFENKIRKKINDKIIYNDILYLIVDVYLILNQNVDVYMVYESDLNRVETDMLNIVNVVTRKYKIDNLLDI